MKLLNRKLYQCGSGSNGVLLNDSLDDFEYF